MPLTYRGARYTVHHQPIEMVETAQTGKFLSASFCTRVTNEIAPPPAYQRLIYGLVNYTA
jgi:hypothetical protein